MVARWLASARANASQIKSRTPPCPMDKTTTWWFLIIVKLFYRSHRWVEVCGKSNEFTLCRWWRRLVCLVNNKKLNEPNERSRLETAHSMRPIKLHSFFPWLIKLRRYVLVLDYRLGPFDSNHFFSGSWLSDVQSHKFLENKSTIYLHFKWH